MTSWTPGGGTAGAITSESDPVAGAALTAHAALTGAVHGIANTAALLTAETDPVASAALTAHAALTSGVHGVTGSLAGLASPTFTGSLGLPTSTLAGRPSVATVGGGRLIYVTDANPGEKFQVSESTTNAWFPVSFITPANTQTASYTLVITDINRAIEMNSASATVVTVPPNSSVAFPLGAIVEVSRYGAGTVTIAAGAGVTIRSRASLLAIGNQYGAVSLRKRATDEWVLVGDLA